MDMATPAHPLDSRAPGFNAAAFTFLAVALIVYALRIYTRVVVVRSPSWDDYVLGFAVASLVVFAALVPVQTHYGGGRHLWDPSPTTNVAQWGRAFFIAEIMYLLALWGVKTSICILLLRLQLSKVYNAIIYGIFIVVTILTLFFVFWITFQCSPVQAQWDYSLRVPGHFHCISPDTYVDSVYGLSAISAATDIITAVLPAAAIFGLSNMNLDTKSRVYASVTLAIGSFACVATLVRFKFIKDFAISTDVQYAVVPLSIASFAEAALGIICASAAVLRPLIRRYSKGSDGSYAYQSDPRSGQNSAWRGSRLPSPDPHTPYDDDGSRKNSMPLKDMTSVGSAEILMPDAARPRQEV